MIPTIFGHQAVLSLLVGSNKYKAERLFQSLSAVFIQRSIRLDF
ncbi:hypothetical protein QLX67_13700 [Balneolaceae bacterium ANBcel3]|nr:hypothetical protein [Balneolaceae bacterium ANBcel3]